MDDSPQPIPSLEISVISIDGPFPTPCQSNLDATCERCQGDWYEAGEVGLLWMKQKLKFGFQANSRNWNSVIKIFGGYVNRRGLWCKFLHPHRCISRGVLIFNKNSYIRVMIPLGNACLSPPEQKKINEPDDDQRRAPKFQMHGGCIRIHKWPIFNGRGKLWIPLEIDEIPYERGIRESIGDCGQMKMQQKRGRALWQLRQHA
jgi:hypothetical protein